MSYVIIALVVVLAPSFHSSESYSPVHYTAAVYEHAREDNFTTPKEIVDYNLAYYGIAAEVAASKGADIIVFPEYGIFPPGDRTRLKDFLEDIPDPKKVRSNPCVESELFSGRPILQYLSCIAKNYSMVVVANTGDIKPCEGETDCPEDGQWHYNTNVAFDSDGALIGRYHKKRLFFEAGMDLPKVEQDPTFNTSFGKFGMFICFDVVFKKITEVAKQGVEAILLPTMWIDPSPLMWSVQLWQSWAMGNNVTFMAANVQMPGYSAVGSGIFNGNEGPLSYTFNPDGKSKVIVAQVPRRQSGYVPAVSNSSITVVTLNGTEDYTDDGSNVPEECSKKVLNDSTDIHTDYRCLEEDTSNYTFAKLTNQTGYIKVCEGGMCCVLDYIARDMQEDYYLGVYNGTYNMFDRYFWWQENCLLVRCDAFGNNSCATFPMKSKTRFHYLHLAAKVSTQYVYPSLLASDMRLVPVTKWKHKTHPVCGSKSDRYLNDLDPVCRGENEDYIARVYFNNTEGIDLLVAGINGRSYFRDPPYIR